MSVVTRIDQSHQVIDRAADADGTVLGTARAWTVVQDTINDANGQLQRTDLIEVHVDATQRTLYPTKYRFQYFGQGGIEVVSDASAAWPPVWTGNLSTATFPPVPPGQSFVWTGLAIRVDNKGYTAGMS